MLAVALVVAVAEVERRVDTASFQPRLQQIMSGVKSWSSLDL